MSPMSETPAALLHATLSTAPVSLLAVVFAVSLVVWLVLAEEVDLRRNNASSG